MKRFILFIALSLIINVIKAQLSGSEVYYYVPAGSSISNSTTVYMVYFDYLNDRFVLTSSSRSTVISKLESNSDYWYDKLMTYMEKPTNGFKYDSSLSTSQRVVYKKAWYGSTQFVPHTFNPMNPYDAGHFETPVIGTYYNAFSYDKESMITWQERKNSSEIINKSYYKRVDLKDLKPKAANRDFLYE